MSDDIAPDVQAKRLAELRAAHPLPAPSEHMMALLQGVATWAGRSIAGEAAFAGPAQTDAADVDATAPAPPAPARQKRDRSPVPGIDVPWSQSPPTLIEQQTHDRAIETDRLLAAGFDPWAPVPSPEAAVHAFHAGKIDPAAEQPPTPPPEVLRPALQQAKALRKAAQIKVDDAARPLARAEADIALLQRDIDAAKGLPDDIGNHYAAQLAAGHPAVLNATLTRRVADRDKAQRHLDALQSALGPLKAKADAAIAELTTAKAAVEHVVIQMVAAKGNAIAIECIAARERYTELQSQLLNLGAVRLGGMGPKFSNDCWLVMNDEPAKPVLHNDLVLEWLRAARELLVDDDV